MACRRGLSCLAPTENLFLRTLAQAATIIRRMLDRRMLGHRMLDRRMLVARHHRPLAITQRRVNRQLSPMHRMIEGQKTAASLPRNDPGILRNVTTSGDARLPVALRRKSLAEDPLLSSQARAAPAA